MDAAKTRFTSKNALLLITALVAAAVPAQAQLQVSTNTVTPSNQQASTFGVSSGSSTGAQVTFTVGANYGNGLSGWFRVLNAQGNPVIGSSLTTQANGPVILYVQVAIANPGAGTSGSIVLTDTSNSTDTQTVTVNYVPSSGGGGGVVAVSPTSVSMATSPTNGAQVFTTVQLSTTSSTTITGSLALANSTTAYLSLSTNSFSVSSAFPTSFTVVGGAYTPAGTYSATIQVTPSGGQTLSIPVSYTSGSGTTANPNSFTLSYPSGTTVQTVNVVSSGSQFYASASSGYGWLLVNNGSSTGYQASNSSIQVSVNTSVAAGLPTGTYSGQVTLYGNDGSTGTISVTLSVNGASTGVVTVSPSSVSLSVPAGTFNLQSQTVNLTTTSSGVFYSASVSNTTGGSWLSLSQYSGTLNGGNASNGLTVYANPSSLGAGTYYGTVTLSYSGAYVGSAQIPVTFTVGSSTVGGTGGLVSPSSLTFVYQIGGTSTQNLSSSILVNATGNWTASVSGLSTSQQWLSVSGTGSSPQQVSVAVSPQGLGAGTYSGQINITTGAGTASVTASLTVTNSMVATTGPSSFLVSAYNAGDANPATTVYVYTSDGSAQTVSASTSVGWITLIPPANPTTVAAYGVQLNPSGLPNGLNTGSITFSVTGAANTSWVIPVAVVVSGSTGTTGPLTFSANQLAFNTTVGSTPPSQTLTVTSSTASFFSVSATSAGWLSVNPTSGSSGTVLTVSVNPTGLTANNYNGTLNFTANGSTQYVSVVMNVGGTTGSGLSASPASLNFAYTVGSAGPSAQVINVSSTGISNLVFTAAASTSSGGSWLTLNVSSGQTITTPSNNFLTASINTAGLTAGTYSGTVALTSSTGTLNVPVTLTVTGGPAVSASPTSLSFAYTAGGSTPAGQTISVNGTGTFSATATSNGSWLSVTPTSGTAPTTLTASVSPGGLTAGTYNGSITVAGSGSSTGSTTVTVSLVVTAPLPTITQVANAASYTSGAISPGEVITIFGTALGPATPLQLTLTSSGTVATTLGNVQVLVNGVACPLIYVSSTQISAVVPYAISIFQTAQVYVNFLGQTSNAMQETVATTAPALFTANSSGSGPGAILNQNLSVNSPSTPAAKGSVVTLYLTGEGQTSPAGVTGSVTQAKAAAPFTPAPLLPVAVLINNSPAAVQFVGEAPGIIAGVLQINVVIPPGTPSGSVPVSVSIGPNSTQNGVTVSVQ